MVAAVTQQKCNRQVAGNNCYKGKLVIKALCSNYTIQLLEGNMDPAKIEASWTNGQTGKTYANVFALGSPCSFPKALQEGDEFYFTLDAPEQNCAVCEAYYPKPAKALAVHVLEKPCP